MKISALVLLASSAVLAQSVDDLRAKYGSPVSETYKVRPGVGVKVRRGPQGKIAEMLVFPRLEDSLIESRNMSFSLETAEGLVDQLVPISARGEFIEQGFVNAACGVENDCAGTQADYENVHVFFNSNSGKVYFLDIVFKK